MDERIWRTKPTKEIIELMDLSIETTFYVVQEKGPLSFVLQDDEQRKYLVTIGSSLNCSCGGGSTSSTSNLSKKGLNDQCIHTIFLLNRVFKIEFTNPLIYQKNYNDSEINQILKKREEVSNKKLNKTKKNKTKGIVDYENDYNYDDNDETSDERNLIDNVSCAICQEDMYSQENLTTCTERCKHRFHSYCIKVWIQHRNKSGERVSCPMCREPWNPEEKFDNKIKKITLKAHLGINCSNCSRTNIKGERFHCINCEKVTLCHECFNSKQHDSSHCFIMKKSPDEKWVGFEKTKDPKKFISVKLNQFFQNCLRDFDKESYAFNKYCVVCKSERISNLQLLRFKILSCLHLVHYKCAQGLFNVFSKNGKNELFCDKFFNKCPNEKVVIFKGIECLKKIREEKEGENNKNEENKLVLLQTNKINMNMNRNKDKQNSIKKPVLYTNNFRKPGSSNPSQLNLALNIQKIEIIEPPFTENNHDYKRRYSFKPPKILPKINNKENINIKQEIIQKNNLPELSLNTQKIRTIDLKVMNFKVKY